MIRSIYVKDFVLLDQLSLDFEKEFSCFTGETGAGKSLLIDAIGILCGDRANASFIKKGADKAFIEAIVEIQDEHPVKRLLEENGYEVEEDGIVVSREIGKDGKSSAKINRRSTTISFLKEVLSSLIDIHSQHDNQYLLNTKYHLSLLDAYCKEDACKQEVYEAYMAYKKKKEEWETFQKEEANPDDLEYLHFQVNEMEKLGLQEGEIEQLETRQKEMSEFDKRSSKIKEALDVLDHSQYESLYDIAKILDDFDEESIQKSKEEIVNAYYVLDEQRETLHTYLDNLSFDEEEYDAVQSRLFTIYNALRKHGNSYASYMAKMQEYQDRITAIENREEHLTLLEKEKEVLYNKFYEKALILSKKRKEKALLLEKEILRELQDLHLSQAKFVVDFKDTVHSSGIDAVEFLIQMNAGTSLQPLSKVASGGELSRLMLGLKSIFHRLHGVETVIFDEIDNGVSGNVAYAIGKKMHSISSYAQVFSVTHLAPVAAWADAHYLVEKNMEEDSTSTTIRVLNKKETIEELAMIANGSTSQVSLEAAKQLYESANLEK